MRMISVCVEGINPVYVCVYDLHDLHVPDRIASTSFELW
jgi:hypothetical protein